MCKILIIDNSYSLIKIKEYDSFREYKIDEINDISMLQMAKYGYFVLAKTSLKLKETYDFPITKKESDKLGAIAHLYKNHKYLF